MTEKLVTSVTTDNPSVSWNGEDETTVILTGVKATFRSKSYEDQWVPLYVYNRVLHRLQKLELGATASSQHCAASNDAETAEEGCWLNTSPTFRSMILASHSQMASRLGWSIRN
jgi:hypothetical protein